MKRRGIALVMVLTVASVVVMLAGAFVMANSANLNTLGANQRQREADLMADSAGQLVYYLLEKDQRFGRTPFSNNAAINLPGKGMRVNCVKSSTSAKLQGSWLDESQSGREATFTVEIYNHLDSVSREVGGINVPADAVLLRIEAHSGNFTSRRDVLYQGEPLYDASLTANKSVMLDSNNSVTVSSQDRSRNWLRSNGNITFNNFVKDSSKRTTVTPDLSGNAGVIWAKGDILTGQDPKPLSGADLSEASKKAGGTLAPKSRLSHDIYKLEPDDLNVFKGGDKKFWQSAGWMPAGTYSLEKSTVAYVDGLNSGTKEVTTVAFTPDAKDGAKIVWYNPKDFKGLTVPTNWQQFNVASAGWDGQANMGGTTSWQSALNFDFETNTFTAANSSINVNGDLRIISKIDNVVPSIKLTSDDKSTGVIHASGDIVIQGTLTGGGALVAKGDIKLMCNPKYDAATATVKETKMDAEKSAGVVLYGGKDVTIFGGDNHNIEFKGLIYAENDVQFWGGGKVETKNGQLNWTHTDDILDHLKLQGAVVARSGGVNIAQTEDVELVYDQEYLKTLTRGMSNNRRRIAHQWTRSY